MSAIFEYILICLILIPVIKPDGIRETYASIDRLLYNHYFSLFAFGVALLLLFIYYMKRIRISSIMVVLCVSFLYLVFATYLNNGPTNTCISAWYKSIAIWSLLEVYRKKLYKPLRAMQIILEILVTLNLLLMLAYPNGMYTDDIGYTACWLLGYKSTFQYYFFLLLTITLLFYLYRKEMKNLIFVMLIIHAETILAWNAMFLVALLIIDVCLALKITNNTKVFNVKTCTSVILGLNVTFTFFLGYIFNMSWIYYLINNILHKNTTLFVRFDIWQKGIEFISKRLLLGYGFTTGKEMISWFGINQVHLHNQFLMILLQGGLIWLVLFCLLMYLILNKLNENKELESSKVLLLIIFAIFVSVIVEIFTTGNSYLIWPIFILGYHTRQLDMQMRLGVASKKRKKLRIKLF